VLTQEGSQDGQTAQSWDVRNPQSSRGARASGSVFQTSRVRGRVWCCAICFFAAATMFSMLKPNFFNKCLRGADAPNVSIQKLCPSQPVYLLQPKSAPCSPDTRAFTFRGRTDSR